MTRRLLHLICFSLCLFVGSAPGQTANDPTVTIDQAIAELPNAKTIEQVQNDYRKIQLLIMGRKRQTHNDDTRDCQLQLLQALNEAAAAKTIMQLIDHQPAHPAYAQAFKHYQQAAEAWEKLFEMTNRAIDAIDQRWGNRPGADPRRKSMAGLMSRSTYELAWICYQLGKHAQQPAEKTQYLQRAMDDFATFTGRPWQNHPVITAGFLGRALCQYEMGQYFKVTQTLAPAQPDNTPADVFARITALRLKAFAAQPSHMKLEAAAKVYFDQRQADQPMTKLEYQMLLIRLASLLALADPKANPEFHRIFQKRLKHVTEQLQNAGNPWTQRAEQLIATTATHHPLSQAHRAGQLYKQGNFNAAADLARQALDHPYMQNHPDLHKNMLYLAAIADYKAKRTDKAYEIAYNFARRFPQHPHANAMFELAWRLAMTPNAETRTDPARQQAILDLAAEAYANHPRARQLALTTAHWQLQQHQPAQAIKTLHAVAADQPEYLPAQYLLAHAHYKAMTQAAATQPASADRHQQAATGALQQYFKTAAQLPAGTSPQYLDQATEMIILLARQRINAPEPDLDQARQLLTLINQQQTHPTMLKARRTLSLELAAASADIQALHQQLSNLNFNAIHADPQWRYALSTTIPLLTRHAEAPNTPATQQAQSRAYLLNIYTNLARHFAGDDKQQSQYRNAQRHRIRLLIDAQRTAKAIALAHQLLADDNTNNQQATRQLLAMALTQAGRHQEAAEQYKQLARTLPIGSDDWFKANLAWFSAVADAGEPDKAAKLFNWFLADHGQQINATWRPRLQQMAERLHGHMPASMPASNG